MGWYKENIVVCIKCVRTTKPKFENKNKDKEQHFRVLKDYCVRKNRREKQFKINKVKSTVEVFIELEFIKIYMF